MFGWWHMETFVYRTERLTFIFILKILHFSFELTLYKRDLLIRLHHLKSIFQVSHDMYIVLVVIRLLDKEETPNVSVVTSHQVEDILIESMKEKIEE